MMTAFCLGPSVGTLRVNAVLSLGAVSKCPKTVTMFFCLFFFVSALLFLGAAGKCLKTETLFFSLSVSDGVEFQEF